MEVRGKNLHLKGSPWLLHGVAEQSRGKEMCYELVALIRVRGGWLEDWTSSQRHIRHLGVLRRKSCLALLTDVIWARQTEVKISGLCSCWISLVRWGELPEMQALCWKIKEYRRRL